MRQTVCNADDLAPGDMVTTHVGPVPVVVIRLTDGTLHAMTDSCLHLGAKLSEGAVLKGLTSDGPGVYKLDDDRDIIRCPWHGYEYDIRTGALVVDERRCVRTFRVEEDAGQIVVES